MEQKRGEGKTSLFFINQLRGKTLKEASCKAKAPAETKARANGYCLKAFPFRAGPNKKTEQDIYDP